MREKESVELALGLKFSLYIFTQVHLPSVFLILAPHLSSIPYLFLSLGVAFISTLGVKWRLEN